MRIRCTRQARQIRDGITLGRALAALRVPVGIVVFEIRRPYRTQRAVERTYARNV